MVLTPDFFVKLYGGGVGVDSDSIRLIMLRFRLFRRLDLFDGAPGAGLGLDHRHCRLLGRAAATALDAVGIEDDWFLCHLIYNY